MSKRGTDTPYRAKPHICQYGDWINENINPITSFVELVTGKEYEQGGFNNDKPRLQSASEAMLFFIPGGKIVGVGEKMAAKWVTSLEKASGSYLLEFQSGKFYAGKGLEPRMMQSIKRIESTGDLLKPGGAKFFPASSTREAFINEYNMMKAIDVPSKYKVNSLLYNKIWSPGKKLLGE